MLQLVRKPVCHRQNNFLNVESQMLKVKQTQQKQTQHMI